MLVSFHSPKADQPSQTAVDVATGGRRYANGHRWRLYSTHGTRLDAESRERRRSSSARVHIHIHERHTRSPLRAAIPATRANELALGVFGLVNGTAGTDGCRQSVGMDDEPLRTAQHQMPARERELLEGTSCRRSPCRNLHAQSQRRTYDARERHQYVNRQALHAPR
jgi:hypothetical protein